MKFRGITFEPDELVSVLTDDELDELENAIDDEQRQRDNEYEDEDDDYSEDENEEDTENE